ncbi:MAG: hypothetical protein DRQ55_12255 [Planctomycetota bacterium]|nr:MAG: hypothetical protein DRQ55_12255 [Planctomycetota bacterium]
MSTAHHTFSISLSLCLSVSTLLGCAPDDEPGDQPAMAASADIMPPPAGTPAQVVANEVPGDDLLHHPSRGPNASARLRGSGGPELLHDVTASPDDAFDADLLRFGDASNYVLLVAKGEIAAGRTFEGSVWLRRKSGTAGAPLDLMVIDAAKDMRYGRLLVTPTEEWAQFTVEHTFPPSDSRAEVALRIGNGFNDPRAQEVWLWQPRLVAIGES